MRASKWYRVGDIGAPGVGARVEVRGIGDTTGWCGTVARIEDDAFFVTLGFRERASVMAAPEVRPMSEAAP